MGQAPPCPYCGASGYRRPDQNTLVCTTCMHEFDIREDLCRTCGRLNRAESATCAYCGTKLKTDLAEIVISTRAKSSAEWRAEWLAADRELKLADQLAAQRRMEAYWEQEHERQRALAIQIAERQARERRFMIGLFVGLAVIILIVAVLIVVLG